MKYSIARLKDYPIGGPMKGAQRWHAAVLDGNSSYDHIFTTEAAAVAWLAAQINKQQLTQLRRPKKPA